MHEEFDILIAGGGMVGGTLAAALANGPWRIGVIESRPFGAVDQPSFDERTIALAFGSRRILEAIGIWPALSKQAAPILHIHVSDSGHFGAAHVDAKEQNVQALGYVVANRLIGGALMPLLAHSKKVDLISPATLEASENEGESVGVRVRTPDGVRHLRARLLVAADGSFSPLRSDLKIPTREENYKQSAVIANVSVSHPAPGTAFERFTDSGPLALLPLGGERYSLVWTQRTETVEEIMALEDTEFLNALQLRFGWRMGRFLAVGKRSVYPLMLIRAERAWRDRTVLVGNALHSLHPVAGQGFNLALRDVAALVDVLTEADDPGDSKVLRRYQHLREPDMTRVIRFTDFLARVFARRAPFLGHVRAAGLLLADWNPLLNRLLARQNMGLAAGHPSRLLSGQEPIWRQN